VVVPNWNRVGSQEPTQSIDNNESYPLYLRVDDDIENRRVRITTEHVGRVTYTENGYTNYDMSEVLDYAEETGYLGSTDRQAGNLPSDSVLREWAQELFEESWDIDAFDNYDTGEDMEQTDSYIEYVEII
jgi:hypothetical protein